MPIFGLSKPKAEHINSELHRKLKSGKKYEGLIPYSDCSSVKLADGDTKVAIDNMAIWSKKYQHHTAKLSKLFAKYPLPIMCEKLHTFLYEHFQYKIDGINQNLRSPACSWKSRADGIDCKSYSIFASTVLLNLGVTHYLRRIKQGVTDGFSHVYVIVPKNQKTNDLKQGYFTIDGTLQQNAEPLFYEKDDILMQSDIPAYGLANPIQMALMEVGATVVKDTLMLIYQGLMNEIIGCDDRKYRTGVVQMRLNKELKEPLERLLISLNDAIAYGNKPRIQHLFNELLKEFDLGYTHLQHEVAYNYENKCINNLLVNSLNYVTKMKEVIDTFYNNFKKTYGKVFNLEEFNKRGYTNDRTFYFVVNTADSPTDSYYRYIVLQENGNKYGIEPIWNFEVNGFKWLNDNANFLKINYGSSSALGFKNEVAPVMEEIKKIRAKYYFGGEALYYFEQPLQRKLYKIWLKYDSKYVDYLKTEAQSLRTANELAMRDFKKRFNREVEEDKRIKNIVKQKATTKKVIGYGAMAFAGLIFIKNYD